LTAGAQLAEYVSIVMTAPNCRHWPCDSAGTSIDECNDAAGIKKYNNDVGIETKWILCVGRYLSASDGDQHFMWPSVKAATH